MDELANVSTSVEPICFEHVTSGNLILVASIALDVDAPDLLATYTYRIPDELIDSIKTGSCVCITLRGREVLGFVISLEALAAADPLVPKLQDILSVLDESNWITPEQIEIAKWISQYYVCYLISAIHCMAPAAIGSSITTYVRLRDLTIGQALETRSISQKHLMDVLIASGGVIEIGILKTSANIPDFDTAVAALMAKQVIVKTREIARPQVIAKTSTAYILTESARLLITDNFKTKPMLGAQQVRILTLLTEHAKRSATGLTSSELARLLGVVSATGIKSLVSKGLLIATIRTDRRSPYPLNGKQTTAPELSHGQLQAASTIRESIRRNNGDQVLLFGVTASGKTEVYLDAITHTLELGRTAIVLLPEIALTAQVVDIFVGRFGEQVAVLHSRLSEGERHDEWRRIQQGTANIVVGARSAVFAPVKNLGLIVLDEEHEASYKQDKNPRYNAKAVAAKRAELTGATLLLGSATPSLETFFNSKRCSSVARQNIKPGIATRITMAERIDNRPLPHVEIVDLREEFKIRKALFSERLAAAIGDRLRLKQQTILFLNRRGYSQFVLCRDCGWTAKCKHCEVSLAYHSFDKSLKCHHCGYSGRTPVKCPDCQGSQVKAFGVGTEKVEEEVLKIYPSARVARMDRDTTTRKGAHGTIIKRFRENEADILIGTQMVAKGLDFPNVTLVGVITADTSINMPDFRAAERTFQLLTQVAGRSGRGKITGEVIIQTFSPDHYAVINAQRHDYESFYDHEIEYRQELKYPPFSNMANIICSFSTESGAAAIASKIAGLLNSMKPASVEIIGPSPAPITRIKNVYRYHVALRGPIDISLSALVRDAVNTLKKEDRRGISIDIDPLSMI